MNLWEQMTPSCSGSQFEPHGHGWQDLHREPLVYVLLHTKLEDVGFMVSEDFFKAIPHYTVILRELMISGCGQFGPQGHGWHNLCRGPPNIAIYFSI